MFKRSERLTTTEFSEYFSSGKRLHTKYFTFITKPLDRRKVAVVVGKKVAKSAVVRNTLRRRVYAILREELDVRAYQGVCIVVVKPTARTLSRKVVDTTLRESIAELLKSA